MVEANRSEPGCPFFCIAEVIAGLDVYEQEVDIPGYYIKRKAVNKRHLAVHLGDLFSLMYPDFDRQAFEEACGEGAGPGKVY